MINIISVDVEEYFHPSELEHLVKRSDWAGMQPRVVDSTSRILDSFARHGVKATFFILGWVAEVHPQLVRRIADEGHEIACHSHLHRLVYSLTPEEFRQDTQRAQATIADACGVIPRLYRAPSYSITRQSWWALEVLADCGFTHDSSIYPIDHDRYGIPGYPRHAHVVETPSGPLTEVPIATARLTSHRLAPVGGGGYMRLLPYRYTAAGIRRINQDEAQPACIYFHPWEIDTGQPRLPCGVIAGWRTYGSLNTMEAKINRLQDEFRFSTMGQVHPALVPAGERGGPAN